jgi:penicillin-binding protein 1A
VRSLLRLLAVVLVAGLGLAALGVAAAPDLSQMATAFHGEANPLPPFAELAQRSLVFDANKNQIDELRVENREPFKLAQVPQVVIDAVIATEDAGFYEHKGVNAKGIFRAALAGINSSSAVQGGSTITQQLVKNALVGSRRDANRKILEAAYAVRLEREWTKDEILERYLNTIFFGNNSYGLEAAAETYFGKTVGQLDKFEGAFLAGLIRNPVGYDPIQRSDRSKGRFKDVLDRLVSTGKMPKDEADAAKLSWQVPDRLQRSAAPLKATTYFTAEVRNQLLQKTDILGADYDTRYQRLFRGGLKVYTTYDDNIQKMAEQARNDQMPDTLGRFDAAMVSLETKTGAVRAMVGGRDFRTSEVNLALTPRQTGSSVKGFITAAAINTGIQNNDVIDGTLPCTWTFPDKSQPDFKVDDGVSNGYGTIEKMTWDSINCAYIRLYLSVGGTRVISLMHELGVKGKLDDLFSFAIGGNEISPMDMAAGYSTIANEGMRHDPFMIERIEDRDGKVIYQHTDPGKQIIEPGVADRTVDILKGVIRQGTATLGKLDGGWPAAGKTGTYDKDKHAWFVGFTRQYTTAVYMGNPVNPNDEMRNIPEFKRFQAVHGGTYPTLIWKQFMEGVQANQEPEDWPKPPDNPRQFVRVYAPFQDCFATFAAGAPDPDAEPGAAAPPGYLVGANPKLNPIATDPNDFTGPAATVQGWMSTYSCKRGLPAPPKPKPKATTTTIAGQTTVPGQTTVKGAPAPVPSLPAAPTTVAKPAPAPVTTASP